MKKIDKKLKIWFIIMFIMLILSFILLRINNKVCQVIGISLLPIIIVIGFIIIKKDKNYDK